MNRPAEPEPAEGNGDENPSLSPLPGHLYVVATPIGNLEDLSRRAAALLSRCDLIACEDTRTTGKLLGRLGIRRPLVSYHEHNEIRRTDELIEKLASGLSIALVCDAGTPGLSDPGFRLVRACRRRHLPVVPAPGPAALTAALSVSGLPTNAFFFAGFLPPRSAARRRFLQKHREFEHTIVLYESCHRIAAFAAEILDVLGPERVVAFAREITKLHETFHVGPIGVVEPALTKSSRKGEFTVLIAPDGFKL